MNNPATFIDHTLLRPDCTAEEIRNLCEDAVEYGFAAVCIPPVFVALAAERLYGSGVAVATVVGFPFGYVPSETKAFETQGAIARGAQEIDMVIHLGAAAQKDFRAVEEDIRQVVEAAGAAPVKVILECCCFDRQVKEALVGCARRAAAAYVKTSTGFGTGGATEEDARLLVARAGKDLKVKAAGGIRDWPSCSRFLAAGVTRIGTSCGPAIIEQWRREASL